MSKKDPKKTAAVTLEENDLDQVAGGALNTFKFDTAIKFDGISQALPGDGSVVPAANLAVKLTPITKK